MSFSSNVQYILQQFDSPDTQKQAWRKIEDVIASLNSRTVPLLFRSIRQQYGLLQRPSARSLLCKAYIATMVARPALCARPNALKNIINNLLKICMDVDSKVRFSCGEAIACVFHNIISLAGNVSARSGTDKLLDTTSTAAEGASNLDATKASQNDLSPIRSQRWQHKVATAQEFSQLILDSLLALMKLPHINTRHGAAMGLLLVCSAKKQTQIAGNVPNSQNGVTMMSPQSFELLKDQIPHLQKQLNQLLWNERTSLGATLCDIWCAMFRHFPNQCNGWPIRGRLTECLLHILQVSSSDVHWQYRAAAIKVRNQGQGSRLKILF